MIASHLFPLFRVVVEKGNSSGSDPYGLCTGHEKDGETWTKTNS